MCLVILAYLTHPAVSVLLGANRDEDRGRPTQGMQLLEAGPPRLAGGRDLRAGGTWMSIAETGLVVALTNQPPRGSDGQSRSRGEIPMLLGRGGSARAAHETARSLAPGVFNPCTVLVADHELAFYLELIPGRPRRIEALDPGVHILENRPWGIESAKERHVRSELGELGELDPDRALDRIRQTLSDPTIPERSSRAPTALQTPSDWGSRPPELDAARVDLGSYGTRSSTLVSTAPAIRPRVWYADGPPGIAEFIEYAVFE